MSMVQEGDGLADAGIDAEKRLQGKSERGDDVDVVVRFDSRSHISGFHSDTHRIELQLTGVR